MALACVWMQLLKLRKTATSQGCKYVASWREECEHDVRESGPPGGQGGLAGVDAGHVPEEDPRLSLLARVQNVVESETGAQPFARISTRATAVRKNTVGVQLSEKPTLHVMSRL